MNEAGVTKVIKPGPKLEVVAENPLPAGGERDLPRHAHAVRGQLFIRSTSVLYCIGK